MQTLAKTSAMLAVLLVPTGTNAGAQVSIGINIGPPPPARVIRVVPAPGPEFVWVAGYWHPVNGRYRWHAGYWTRPPYAGARWVAPRHHDHQFFLGTLGGAFRTRGARPPPGPRPRSSQPTP